MAVVRLSVAAQQSGGCDHREKSCCRKRTSLCPVAAGHLLPLYASHPETVGLLWDGLAVELGTSLREDDEHITLTGVQGGTALPENDADARPPDIDPEEQLYLSAACATGALHALHTDRSWHYVYLRF